MNGQTAESSGKKENWSRLNANFMATRVAVVAGLVGVSAVTVGSRGGEKLPMLAGNRFTDGTLRNQGRVDMEVL
jgi:hypothetical protein